MLRFHSLVFATTLPIVAAAQNPLSPIRDRGQAVTPAFEGWYKNSDGSFTLSFGYFNRNMQEAVEISLGSANFVRPSAYDGTQPTHFDPRRHWGVFGIRVPADFGKQRLTWTLVNRGDSVTIPGSLAPQWQLDALEGEAGSGNTPPRVKFGPAEPEGAGPGGIYGPPRQAKVGTPHLIEVWATDDGAGRSTVAGTGGRGAPVTLMWFKHSGPGDVTFAPADPKPGAGGRAATTATFKAPGEYVLRIRLNDASGVVSAGHAQCCWTNGFVRVSVTP